MSTQVQPREKGKLKKWQPRKWRIEYDRIVVMSVCGMPNAAIAKEVNFTKEYISVILNLPQAADRYKFFHQKYLEQQASFIPETLNHVARKTAERLKQVVDNDALFEKNPFAVIDRGMDVLKGLRHLTGGGNGAIGNETPGAHISIGSVTINAAQKTDIMEGLSKLEEIKLIHGK
jgi:hypothetical protein